MARCLTEPPQLVERSLKFGIDMLRKVMIIGTIAGVIFAAFGLVLSLLVDDQALLWTVIATLWLVTVLFSLRGDFAQRRR